MRRQLALGETSNERGSSRGRKFHGGKWPWISLLCWAWAMGLGLRIPPDNAEGILLSWGSFSFENIFIFGSFFAFNNIIRSSPSWSVIVIEAKIQSSRIFDLYFLTAGNAQGPRGFYCGFLSAVAREPRGYHSHSSSLNPRPPWSLRFSFGCGFGNCTFHVTSLTVSNTRMFNFFNPLGRQKATLPNFT